MKGYWRHADGSAKTLQDGWLHTGDIGHLDADGYLFIHGRQSNLIALAGGEKLHPEPVEEAIKAADLVEEAMVIGDRCKNLYALVTLDPDAAAKLPPEERQPTAKRRLQEATRHLAPHQRPKDVLILPPFSVEDGTITVSLKLRRHKVWERDGERIRAFLAANGEVAAAAAANERPM
jgi:long-chain acyl-CoA synthetase